jgi:hypothetical protein
MPWVVGIDEAGYGPNLGPLVQAAVALRLPDADLAGWETLRPVVRRCGEKADGRLLIDDSKSVYTRHGLEALERGIWSITSASTQTIHTFLWGNDELPGWGLDLRQEFWFNGDDSLPLAIDPAEHWSATEVVREAIGQRWLADFRIVSCTQFNQIVDEFGSKAVVLSRGLIDLLSSIATSDQTDGEPLLFHCDKLGGRNFYGAMLQEAFPGGWIVPEIESAGESRYRIELLDRPVTVTFRPRADGESVAVALASMLCKYLREVCMGQFNRFWAAFVPGLRPTAGYPGDATRFFDEIQPAMKKLGLADDQVWRKR